MKGNGRLFISNIAIRWRVNLKIMLQIDYGVANKANICKNICLHFLRDNNTLAVFYSLTIAFAWTCIVGGHAMQYNA